MPAIKETTELAIAIASLIKGGLTANADGKITIIEAGSLLLGNAGKVLAAVKGISEIPGELTDLDELEFEELYFTVIEEMEWVDEGPARAVVGSFYDLIKQGLITTRVTREFLASKTA